MWTHRENAVGSAGSLSPGELGASPGVMGGGFTPRDSPRFSVRQDSNGTKRNAIENRGATRLDPGDHRFLRSAPLGDRYLG